MVSHFTLEYWIEDNWYVGGLKEVPGVFSQGESREEPEENVRDAYRMMMEEELPLHPEAQTKALEIEI